MKKKPSILIVDDEKDTCDALELIVEKQGYDSICAYNGAEAITALQEANPHPDLILLDIMMPGVTAKEVIDWISKTARCSMIKVIYVSAVNISEAEEKELLKPKQVVGFIAKPFELKKVVEEVNKALG